MALTDQPLTDQPRVRGNDWTQLDPPPLGGWAPSLSVTVVVPAYQCHTTLDHTLASLAAQSYPQELMEVLVVDDGSSPPLRLPELRPHTTRIIRATGSWGRAHACRVGAEAAQGDVLHWYDADMVAFRDQVEAQMRWHHLVDYGVVLGHKLFVDPGEGLPTVEQTYHAVRRGEAELLFADRWTARHEWVEDFNARTGNLARAHFRSYLVHTGATASVRRELYRETGGMDPAMKLGEDIELGYRLQARGGLFIPDGDARSWHLGRTQVMQRQEEVNRYNNAFFADRVPDFRKARRNTGRGYAIPYVQVVVDAHGAGYDSVLHSVHGVLDAKPHDVSVLVVGPWNELGDARRPPLLDPLKEARMLEAELSGDPRVHLVESVASSAYPSTFRFVLPVGWAPGPKTVLTLLEQMRRRGHGLMSVVMPDGAVARLECVPAWERAVRLARNGEDLDDVVDEIAGTWWCEGREEGFTHVGDEPADRGAPGTESARTESPSAPDAMAAAQAGAAAPPRARGQATASPEGWLRRRWSQRAHPR